MKKESRKSLENLLLGQKLSPQIRQFKKRLIKCLHNLTKEALPRPLLHRRRRQPQQWTQMLRSHLSNKQWKNSFAPTKLWVRVSARSNGSPPPKRVCSSRISRFRLCLQKCESVSWARCVFK